MLQGALCLPEERPGHKCSEWYSTCTNTAGRPCLSPCPGSAPPTPPESAGKPNGGVSKCSTLEPCIPSQQSSLMDFPPWDVVQSQGSWIAVLEVQKGEARPSCRSRGPWPQVACSLSPSRKTQAVAHQYLHLHSKALCEQPLTTSLHTAFTPPTHYSYHNKDAK